MKTIGLCMIVKDEAAIIERCLDSVRPLVDYVVVQDTGSSDGTQRIVRDYLRRHDLAGEVFDEKWRDFAHNRTRALQKLRENPAVAYALVMDADDFIVYDDGFDPQAFKHGLTQDHYSVEFREAGVQYLRVQLCRNALPYRYRGVLHEFVESPPDASWGRTSGFRVESRREGARSRDPEKYRKDAALLERALADETDPHLRARYTFYLGQSYRDCGDREKALAAFLARAELGFWAEEVYMSLCYAARLQEALDCPFETVFQTYERAARAVPQRAEALHGASRLARNKGRNREGYEIGKRGLSLTAPADGLFVENWIYDFGLLDEFSINAYWAGYYRESLDACLRLLGENKFPEHERNRIFGNARFAIGKLPAANSLDVLIAASGARAAPPALSNPSVVTPRPSSQMVSVITPTHDRPAFLAAALGYFRSQDHRNIEWLILDDSAERTELFDRLPDRNIRYFHHAGPRLSIGEKRNRLVEKARGEIIVHFDDDDFYSPDYVTAMVSALAERDADLINLRGWYLFDRRSSFFGYWDLMQKEGLHYRCDHAGVSVVLLDAENNVGFKDNHLGFGFSYAYKRKVWEHHKFPALDIDEDGQFALQAIAAGFTADGIHDTVGRCLHVLHKRSSSCCFPQYRLPEFQLADRFSAHAVAISDPTVDAAVAPRRPRRAARMTRPAFQATPIFIHASWRTSSTWFWSKFRELTEVVAYFEPFGELNPTLTPANVVPFDPTVWESRHPKINSYFLEYLPLLRRAGGVRLYRREMAYDWFFPAGGLPGELRREEKQYLALLLRHAGRLGKVPVLGFVRSLGRAQAIKRSFGGVHILQHRNMWPQWLSYLSYKRQGDLVFYDTVATIVGHARDDAFLSGLGGVYARRVAAKIGADRAGEAVADRVRLLGALPEHEVFALFMALHVYLYLQAETVADIVVDATRLARDPDHLATMETQLRALCGMNLSFDDVRDERRPDPHFDSAAIDWTAIREHGRAAAAALAGIGDDQILAGRAEVLIDATFVEMHEASQPASRPMLLAAAG